MSAACPCVVPPVGGHLDYFDEHSGIKVDARDTEAIVQFIQQVQQDEVLWRGYADRALEISRGYSAQAYQQRVGDFLRAIQAYHFN
jgi:glycosyltransferase involved in cell wall biosynthesis